MGAVLVVPTRYFDTTTCTRGRAAAQNRLAACNEFSNYVQDGGLMSDGPTVNDMPGGQRATWTAPQGLQPRRPADRTPDQVRAPDQPEDREGARPHDPQSAAARGRGDPVIGPAHVPRHADRRPRSSRRCRSAAQQSPRIPRVGVIGEGTASDAFVAAFRQGLRDLGYVEGQKSSSNFAARTERSNAYPSRARAARMPVDVLVVGGGVSAQTRRRRRRPCRSCSRRSATR